MASQKTNPATTRSNDDTRGLHLLAAGHSHLPASGPSRDILESFPNRFPNRRYVVSISFPEFTSLCPVTGQPDFATIVVEYIPHELCVESKSFKLYMFAYRNHQSFMETITNTVLEDLVALLNPDWARVKGLFVPRGGTRLHVFAEHYREDMSAEEREAVREAVRDWKMEGDPHRP